MFIKMKKTMAGPDGLICADKIGRVSEQRAIFLVGKGLAEYVGEKPEGADKPLLAAMKKAQLRILCKEAGVSATGNVDTLIKRLEKKAKEDDLKDETAATETTETTAIR